MSRPRVVLVSFFFEPDGTGIAPYASGVARHLADHGWDVEVLTGVPHYPQWRVSPEYRHVFRTVERTGSMTVRRLRHFVPRNPSALGRALLELSFFVQGMTSRVKRRPGQQTVVVGITPSISGAVVARQKATSLSAPLVLVFQDLVGRGAKQSASAGDAVSRLVEGIESRLVAAADQLVAISPQMATRLVSYGTDPARITVIPNWSHLRMETASRAWRREAGWEHRTVVLHAGNMGKKQDLQSVIEAARLSRSISLLFVFVGDGNQRRLLQAAAKDLQNVQFLPQVPEHQFASVLASADILLVNERPTLNDMSLPSKLTSYWSTGLPVVANVAPQSATWTMIFENDLGVVSDANEKGALVRTLEALEADPSEQRRLGQQGRNYVETHLTEAASCGAYRTALSKSLRSGEAKLHRRKGL